MCRSHVPHVAFLAAGLYTSLASFLKLALLYALARSTPLCTATHFLAAYFTWRRVSHIISSVLVAGLVLHTLCNPATLAVDSELAVFWDSEHLNFVFAPLILIVAVWHETFHARNPFHLVSTRQRRSSRGKASLFTSLRFNLLVVLLYLY